MIHGKRRKQETLFPAVEAGLDKKFLSEPATRSREEVAGLAAKHTKMAANLAGMEKKRTVPEFMTVGERLTAIEKKLSGLGKAGAALASWFEHTKLGIGNTDVTQGTTGDRAATRTRRDSGGWGSGRA